MAGSIPASGSRIVLGAGAPPAPGSGPGCQNTIGTIQEFDSYIAPDGTEFRLSAPDVRAVISDTGSGMPPINYITERGPFQHGVTLKDFFLQPRTIQMVVRQNFANRLKWYVGKASLVNVLRPNRTPNSFAPGTVPSTGVLRKYMPDGSKIDLAVLIQSGPKFEPQSVGQGWDAWSFQETLQFTAFNPIYFNPVQHEVTFANNASQLVFPATFPIQFGSLDVTTTVTYAGSWEEYPSFTINGPLSSFKVENQTTGISFQVNYPIQAGDQILISLAYGNKDITLLNGMSLLPYLTPDSDLVDFKLVPHPISFDGVNTIRVTAPGAGAGTVIFMDYFDRFVTISPLNTALGVS